MCESMLTVNQVAEMLGVSADTIYRLKSVPDGIPAYKVGRCIRFKPDEVAAYLAAQAVKPIVKQESPRIQRFHYTPGMKVVNL